MERKCNEKVGSFLKSWVVLIGLVSTVLTNWRNPSRHDSHPKESQFQQSHTQKASDWIRQICLQQKFYNIIPELAIKRISFYVCQNLVCNLMSSGQDEKHDSLSSFLHFVSLKLEGCSILQALLSHRFLFIHLSFTGFNAGSLKGILLVEILSFQMKFGNLNPRSLHVNYAQRQILTQKDNTAVHWWSKHYNKNWQIQSRGSH